jgi:hypothetical protein
VAPKPHCLSVRGVSHALDGLLRLSARGFVSPHSHVQGSLFRGLSLARSRHHLVGDAVPSRRCRRSADDVATAATNRRLVLRALIRSRIRCRRSGC